MANKIKLKRSNTGGSAPTAGQLDTGEVALNMVDRLLYFKDPSANIKSLDIADLNSFTTSDLTEGTNLYYTDARFDSRLATKTTDNLTEGTNLYYTDARFDARLSTKNTGDLAEGLNLYYTDARARGAISATGDLSYNSTTGVISYTESVNSVNGATGVVVLDTDDVSEGTTNLYYTDARVDAHLNTPTAASGEFLSWTGTDYDWVAGGGGATDLDSLTDVTITTVLDNQLLAYDSGSSQWLNTSSITTVGFENAATSFGEALIASRTNSSGNYGASFQNSKSSTLADGDFSTAAGFAIKPSTGSTAYPGFIHGEYHGTLGNRLHFKLYNDGVSTFGTNTGLKLGENDAEFFDGDLTLLTAGGSQTIGSATGNIILSPFTSSQVSIDQVDTNATLTLNNANPTIANNDYLGSLNFAKSGTSLSRIDTKITDTGSGTEDTQLEFYIRNNGGDNVIMVMDPSRTNVSSNLDVQSKWLQVQHSSATPTQYMFRSHNHGSGQLVGQIEFWGQDSTASSLRYSRISSRADDNTAGSIDSSIEFQVSDNGFLFTAAKIDKSGIELVGYRETANTPASSGTIAPDPAGGTYGVITLSGNITFNGFTNPIAGQSYTLVIKQPSSGGPYTLTSSMLFSGAGKTLSVAANAVDVMTVFYDGTNYYASLTLGYA